MVVKWLSLFFLAVGIFVLIQVTAPFLSFKTLELTSLKQSSLIDPASSSVLGVSVENINNFPYFFSKRTRDFDLPYKEFYLSISKLKLDHIRTAVDSNNFEHNLGHLPGSALPGERGNVFVTGHSSLPQFFSADNFQTIFANLPNLKVGDEITLSAAGQDFKYGVENLKIINPNQTEVINPPDQDGRYLTLMTCVPPGFNTKRLIVLAKLR